MKKGCFVILVFFTFSLCQFDGDLSKELLDAASSSWKQYQDSGDKSKLEKAIQYQSEAVKLRPTSAQGLHDLAIFHNTKGNVQDSISLLQKAVALEPNNIKILNNCARVYIHQSMLPEAAEALEHSVALQPTMHETVYKLGTVQYELGHKRSAIERFRQAATISPDSLYLLSLATVLRELGDDECLDVYEQAIRHNPAVEAAYVDAAVAYSDRDMHREAEAHIRRAVALNPNAQNVYHLGNSLLGQKKYEDAIVEFRKALQLDPDHVNALHNFGYTLYLLKQWTQALPPLLKAARLSPRNAMHVTAIANTLRKAGQKELSLLFLRTIRQPPYKPRDRYVPINDMLTVRSGELATAISIADTALADGFKRVSLFPKADTPKVRTARHLVPDAVIVYMVGPRPEHTMDFLQSLEYLRDNFLHWFPYPLLVFHETLSVEMMEEVVQIYDHITFHRLNLTVPEHIDMRNVSVNYHQASIGYRHMCRFFSGGIYQHEALRRYQWYWRLDTDSFILQPMAYDPIRFMAERGLTYGYTGIGREDEDLVVGLWEATVKHIQHHNIKPTYLQRFTNDGVWDRSYYYSNFEIGRLSFFRSSAYAAYFKTLDDAGGIYYYRWGDAPVHLLGVAMLVPEDQVHQFHDIPYSHKVYVTLPND